MARMNRAARRRWSQRVYGIAAGSTALGFIVPPVSTLVPGTITPAAAAGGLTASAEVVNSGCNVRVIYKWTGLNNPAKHYTQFRIFDETTGQYRLLGQGIFLDPSGMSESRDVGGINGHSYVGDGEIKTRPGNVVIEKSVVKSAPLHLSC